MKYVEIITRSDSKTLLKIAERAKSVDTRVDGADADGMRRFRLLVHEDRLQDLLDDLQLILGAQASARIIVLPVDTVLPEPPESARAREDAATTVREALYDEVERNTRVNPNFLVLVGLSTLVAAIGMVENNVAVVIGGMVIAPLLGPNLALSLGTALGNTALIRQSALALLVGITLPVLIGATLALCWPGELSSSALLERTDAGPSAVVLALASGAAAALSLTSGLSSVLVGVMVAVALLPPATALGILLGQSLWQPAAGAALLLAIDVVCINLASKTVFLLKGVRPRSGDDRHKAQRAMLVYIAGWIISLVALVALSYSHQGFGG